MFFVLGCFASGDDSDHITTLPKAMTHHENPKPCAHPKQEEALFYDGYGDVPVNPAALAYYRYDRLIEDVALFCKQIRGTTRSDVNRELAMTCLEGSFLPDSCVDIAIAADDEWSPHNATDEKGHD